jgi:hypothetical protein
MAEPSYQIIERLGTPILNGDASKHPHQTLSAPETASKLTVTVTPAVSQSSGVVDWHDLYPVHVGRGALVIRALTLLGEGQLSLKKALDYLKDDDPVSADYEITLFQGAIPELFCCNSIGEGFATIVVALRWALKNRHGDPLTYEQSTAVLGCVDRLNRELFLKYETALDLIENLESVGLNTDPSIAVPLATLLIDDTDELPTE